MSARRKDPVGAKGVHSSRCLALGSLGLGSDGSNETQPQEAGGSLLGPPAWDVDLAPSQSGPEPVLLCDTSQAEKPSDT